LRLLAEELGVARLDLGPQGGRLEFSKDTRADPGQLISMMQKSPQDFRLDGPQKLRLLRKEENPAERLRFAEQLMRNLAPQD